MNFNKTLLFVFISCFRVIIFAQKDTANARNLEFLIRGKVLGYVIIEDTWVRSFSIGGEAKINRHFSLSADLVHFRWKFEKEVYPFSGNYNDYFEYALFDARNYLAFEARYYPLKVDQIYRFKPYVAAVSKVGGRFIHIQDDYPPDENEVIRLNSDFKDLGTSLGIQIGNSWGFDVNMGASYRWETKNEDIFINTNYTQYSSNVKDQRWVYNIRINFFVNLNALKQKK